MAIVNNEYKISITPGKNTTCRVRCSQGDTSRSIYFLVYNESQLFVIPSGTSVSIHGINSFGYVFLKNCTYSGSTVTLQLDEDITGVSGVSVAEIVFTNANSEVVGTANLVFIVEENPLYTCTVDINENGAVQYLASLVTLVDTLSARINNIITPSGEASLSEVVDARLSGYSGITYQNLKLRIDSDFAALNNKTEEISSDIVPIVKHEVLDNSELEWVEGSYISSVDGSIASSSVYVIANKSYIPARKGDTIVCSAVGNTRFVQRVCIYSEPAVSSFLETIANYSAAANNIVINQDCYLRFSIREWSSGEFDYDIGKQSITITRKIYKKGFQEYNFLNEYVENCAITSAIDGIHARTEYNLSTNIYVTKQNEYVLSGEYVGTEPVYPSVTEFDEDGAILNRTAFTWTGGTYTHRLRFKYPVSYVRITFPKKASNVKFVTYAEIDNITNGNVQLLLNRTKNNYNTIINNPIFTSQVLGVAMTYLGKTSISYKAKDTALTSDDYGTNIDCSTFIGLVLRGWDCDTVYSGSVNSAGDDSDSDMNEEEVIVSNSYWASRRNTKYVWTMNPAKWKLRYNYLNTFDVANDNTYEPVRRAATLAQWMIEIMGWEIQPSVEILQPGDIVFFSRKNRDGTYVAPARYRKINHVSMFSHINDVGKHICIQVTGNRAGESPCVLYSLEDTTGEYVNGIDTIVAICRPNYSCNSSYIENKTPTSLGVNGNICYDNDYLYVCTASGWKKLTLENL